MRTSLGLSLLMLVSSACVLPTADEAAELAEQESALTLQEVPRLQLSPKSPILPELDKQFAQTLAELRCRAHPERATAHFVVPGPRLDFDGSGEACLDVPGSSGTWYGEPAFPGVVRGLCRYAWEGSTTPDYLTLVFAAARQPGSLHFRITADCRPVQPSCRSVTSCAAATPATRPTPAEIASHFTPETLPCPACRGAVARRTLVAVLSTELASQALVSAEVIKDGRRYTTTFRPSGGQVDSYEIPGDFPDTTDVEFRPFLSAGVVPAP